jgi:5-methylcytosine-specific restriction endonuclease McrA
MSYWTIKDPAWVELRRKVFERDKNRCVGCGGLAIKIHCFVYVHDPEEVSIDDMAAACNRCSDNNKIASQRVRENVKFKRLPYLIDRLVIMHNKGEHDWILKLHQELIEKTKEELPTAK